jgi:hypothetical protein
MVKIFWKATVTRVSPEAPVGVVKQDGIKPYRVTFDQDVIDDQAAALVTSLGWNIPETVAIVPGTPTTVANLYMARGWPVIHLETAFPVPK